MKECKDLLLENHTYVESVILGLALESLERIPPIVIRILIRPSLGFFFFSSSFLASRLACNRIDHLSTGCTVFIFLSADLLPVDSLMDSV